MTDIAAMATLANPFQWSCVVETESAAYQFELSLAGNHLFIHSSFVTSARTRPIHLAVDQALQDDRARIFMDFARFPVVRVVGTDCMTQTLVQLADLRYTQPGSGRGTFSLDVPVECPTNDTSPSSIAREMNDTKQIEALKSLADATKESSRPEKRVWVASVRVSPGAYLVVSSVLTFFAGLLLRSEHDGWALLAIVVAWMLLPALAMTDKIVFDGQSLVRRGVVPFMFQLISGRKHQLSVAEVERVDTSTVRTLRRGGRVRYRYRSQITGRGTGFVFASGGRRYREMVQRLFPLIHDDKIDLRTRELRDYLCDPKSLNRELDSLKLAPSDVLENATAEFKLGGKKDHAEEPGDAHEISPW